MRLKAVTFNREKSYSRTIQSSGYHRAYWHLFINHGDEDRDGRARITAEITCPTVLSHLARLTSTPHFPFSIWPILLWTPLKKEATGEYLPKHLPFLVSDTAHVLNPQCCHWICVCLFVFILFHYHPWVTLCVNSKCPAKSRSWWMPEGLSPGHPWRLAFCSTDLTCNGK